MSLEIMYFAHGTTYGNAQSKLIKETNYEKSIEK